MCENNALFALDKHNAQFYLIGRFPERNCQMDVKTAPSESNTLAGGVKTKIRRTREQDALELQRAYLSQSESPLFNEIVRDLYNQASIAAGNAWSAYNAASTYGGGSSEGWSLRNRGARWMRKAFKLAEQARAAS